MDYQTKRGKYQKSAFIMAGLFAALAMVMPVVGQSVAATGIASDEFNLRQPGISEGVKLDYVRPIAAASAADQSAQPGLGTEVRLSPARLEVGVQATGKMSVEVTGVDDLYGMQLQLSYDSELVEVVDADPRTPGVQVELGEVFSGFDVFDVKNEATDRLINVGVTRRAPATMFSGSGALIDITWRGLSPGQSKLQLTGVTLANRDGKPLDAAVVSTGAITVVEPDRAVLKGRVAMQGNANTSLIALTLGDQPPAQPAADGTFALPLNSAGDYTLKINGPGCLSAVAQGNVPAGTLEINLGEITLPGGEVTGDDLIDIFDLAVLGSRYGGTDPQSDINGDGKVDILDLALAAGNYGQSGPIVVGLNGTLRNVLAQAGITPLDFGPSPPPAQVTLGQALYFDRELSGNRDVACSTCHLPSEHTSDNLPVSIGVGGDGLGLLRQLGLGRHFIPRNAPEIFNRGAPEWTTVFWDSRISGSLATGFSSPAGADLPASLENVLAVQAMFPVTSRDEMRGETGDVDVFGQPNELAAITDKDFAGMWSALMDRLLAFPEYVSLFEAAYPSVPTGELGFEHAANAIAAFEIDAFTFTNSPWDRYVAGDDGALSDQAKQGALLFYGRAGCGQCHSGNLLTDQAHHNIGAPQVGPGKGAEAPLDFGRGRETNRPADKFAFRTPPLRNVALTGPWLHSGAYTSLEAVVRHHLNPAQALRTYNPSQLRLDYQNTWQNDPAYVEEVLAQLDPLVATPVNLSQAEVEALIAFLHALTDPAAVDMSHTAPTSVPSGLPIDK